VSFLLSAALNRVHHFTGFPLGPVPRLTASPLTGMAAGAAARAVGIPSPILICGLKSQAGLDRPNTTRSEQWKLSFSQGIYFKSSLSKFK
jgi:hypothetical protein